MRSLPSLGIAISASARLRAPEGASSGIDVLVAVRREVADVAQLREVNSSRNCQFTEH